ncbi:uncharacterized protein K444DRAFT_415140 [Hyaloscypha bicolor E]|uniref:Uncharacterized protein n=1 Tax=Hyaloscypha bicolor E TaxID=1095630 RepID=A0A2J6T6P8_9HELO|nr:uncharacterized protein K444DRAFT_415140 [Hyaloscypha bicolor E]PMD58701.1 hypothetical protein K444DRAFT_415140 [Hyaloscypha bicolor E]
MSSRTRQPCHPTLLRHSLHVLLWISMAFTVSTSLLFLFLVFVWGKRGKVVIWDWSWAAGLRLWLTGEAGTHTPYD